MITNMKLLSDHTVIIYTFNRVPRLRESEKLISCISITHTAQSARKLSAILIIGR